jgi:hypothetical protein
MDKFLVAFTSRFLAAPSTRSIDPPDIPFTVTICFS